jgi:glutaredoxin-related protein
MRYWLRNYSGWPTYPQIYSQGKLIGGLDTVKELIAKDNFIQLFPKSCRVTSAEEKL